MINFSAICAKKIKTVLMGYLDAMIANMIFAFNVQILVLVDTIQSIKRNLIVN